MKVINIVVEPELIVALENLREQQGVSRSQVVREACWHYLRQMADRRYEESYRRLPEGSEDGEAQAAVLGEVLHHEDPVDAAR